MGDFLRACVLARLNIVVSGGTSTGKTTLLNILSGFIPDNERIVTIEDAAELQLQQEHMVRLEARPPNVEGKGQVTIRQLVINALRMRPDRIVVGEVRGGEALDMLQAMNTGHDGSLTTAHSNAPRDTLHRVETMVLMAGMDLPLRAIREQIASAFDLIVHLERLPDGTRRVTQITEVQGMEGDVIVMQDIFRYVQTGLQGRPGAGLLHRHRHPAQVHGQDRGVGPLPAADDLCAGQGQGQALRPPDQGLEAPVLFLDEFFAQHAARSQWVLPPCPKAVHHRYTTRWRQGEIQQYTTG